MPVVTPPSAQRRQVVGKVGGSEGATVAGDGPTAHRIMLGAQLRRLRQGRRINRSEAGYHIRASESKISRMELGRVGFKERDVGDLLTLYGVVAEEDRAPILALTRKANQPGWWQSFADVLPGWLEPYLGLEGAATLIRTYQVQLIPALLQTGDYTRAVIMQSSSPGILSSGAIERTVAMRMTRQRILSRPDPPNLWAIVDEAALRRRIGTPAVMRAQLKHLIALSEQPNVVVQVLPTAFGAHVAEGGAFSILRFAEPDLPDVVYLEHLTGMTGVEKPDEVDCYEELVNRLSVASTRPDGLAEYLAKMAASF